MTFFGLPKKKNFKASSEPRLHSHLKKVRLRAAERVNDHRIPDFSIVSPRRDRLKSHYVWQRVRQ